MEPLPGLGCQPQLLHATITLTLQSLGAASAHPPAPQLRAEDPRSPGSFQELSQESCPGLGSSKLGHLEARTENRVVMEQKADSGQEKPRLQCPQPQLRARLSPCGTLPTCQEGSSDKLNLGAQTLACRKMWAPPPHRNRGGMPLARLALPSTDAIQPGFLCFHQGTVNRRRPRCPRATQLPHTPCGRGGDGVSPARGHPSLFPYVLYLPVTIPPGMPGELCFIFFIFN